MKMIIIIGLVLAAFIILVVWSRKGEKKGNHRKTMEQLLCEAYLKRKKEEDEQNN